ncbi:MAG: endonuclease domain-containing protein [Balneola sp.]
MKAYTENHHLYNKKLRKFAVKNRNKATKAEACLWKYALRKKQMNGYSFKRQRPVLDYIADFMCQKLNLIIEVDGSSHDGKEAIIGDRQRQRRLEEIGFTVIRFTNEDVLTNMDSVRIIIASTIERLESQGIPK